MRRRRTVNPTGGHEFGEGYTHTNETGATSTPEFLLVDLFGQMRSEAQRFAEVMLELGAMPTAGTILQEVPRRFKAFRTRDKATTEHFWVIRGPGQTNYGGFPLVFLSGEDRENDVYHRIVVTTTGQLKLLTSFGEAVTDPHDVTFVSRPAEARDVIFPPALSSESDRQRLYDEWTIDCANLRYSHSESGGSAQDSNGTAQVFPHQPR